MKKTLEKILNTLEKCCEETHQNGKSESDESKSKSGNQEASTKQKLSEALSIDKRYIFDSSDEKTKEKTESVYNETIKEIKGKEDFRQRDELFSDDEKWYLICDEGGSKIDISLSYDKIKSIPCNVIFNNCNIDLYIDEPKGTKKDNAETIKNRLYFYNCTFEKSLNLKNIIFEKILTFNQCAFYNDLEIYQNQFLDHLVFINCLNEQNDKKIISLDLQDNEFKGYLFIKNCTIEKINLWKNKFKNRCYFVDSKFGYKDKDNQIKLNFSNTHFEDEVYFNNSEFYNYADFHECKFKDNTYFNNSHFKDYVDFCECEFDNIACFYGVTFEKTPNFSQAIFKGNLNVVNTNLNFAFCDLQEKIKQECNNFNKKNEQDEKPLGEIANDFRDSFRTFKNALIKDNNLLDASKFHKYELYCKELELKQNWNQRGKNVESMRDVEKNIWRIRDLVDFLLLGFYRKLCDHHTDFLKVFNNLILLISLYILFIFIGSFKFNLEKNSIQNLDTISDMFPYLTKVKQLVIDLSPIQQYYDYILISFIVVCFICLVIIFYKIFKNIKLDFIIIKNIIFKDIIKSILNLCACLLFLLIILIYINIYIPKNQNNLNILSNIGIFFTFCIFYLWTICLNALFLRYIFICISYISVVKSMGANITILNPFIGKLIHDKIFSNDPLFIYLTFAYTILMFLVLFSLQKTARKNSIVPS